MADPRVRQTVDHALQDGLLWRDPLVQINPISLLERKLMIWSSIYTYLTGTSVDVGDLVTFTSNDFLGCFVRTDSFLFSTRVRSLIEMPRKARVMKQAMIQELLAWRTRMV
jgi:hypothetical protein